LRQCRRQRPGNADRLQQRKQTRREVRPDRSPASMPRSARSSLCCYLHIRPERPLPYACDLVTYHKHARYVYITRTCPVANAEPFRTVRRSTVCRCGSEALTSC
jgi:hypothetical protein